VPDEVRPDEPGATCDEKKHQRVEELKR
jgi:hypothetical protein